MLFLTEVTFMTKYKHEKFKWKMDSFSEQAVFFSELGVIDSNNLVFTKKNRNFAANMKKTISTIVAVMFLTACGGNGNSIFGDSSFDMNEAKVTKVVPVVDQEDAPTCRINLQVKYVKGDDERARNINNAIEQRLFMYDSLTMQQAVDSFANFYTSEYQKNMAPLYREDADDDTKHAWYEFIYEIETDTQSGKDGCLVYIINLNMYEGGAHGIYQQLTMNFDEKTGKQITYDDLFVQGYEYRLREMLLDELKRQTKTSTLEELQEQDYLFAMDIFAPQNFILGKDGIIFIYNPYEIAPYAKGNTELTLTYSKLKEIMK